MQGEGVPLKVSLYLNVVRPLLSWLKTSHAKAYGGLLMPGFVFSNIDQGAFHALRPKDLRRRPDFFVGVAASFFSKIGSWRDGVSKFAYLDMNTKLSSIFSSFF